jgi:flagellar basal-body rod protein FlgB
MTDSAISRKLFDRTFSFIERSLDIRTLNHKVLSANIANAESPDYRVREVPFQRILEKTLAGVMNIGLKRTHPQHIFEALDSDPDVETTTEAVNIDREMAKLAENNIMFQAGVQMLVKKFETLQFTITDLGR